MAVLLMAGTWHHGEYCFAAGTPLLTPNGGAKPIEEFVAGELILSRDQWDVEGPVEPKVVEEVFVRFGGVLCLSAGGQTIKTTHGHLFWVVGKGWIPAKHIQVGDWLLGHDGQKTRVDAITEGEWQTLYNLRVADHHTYFVGCSEWGFSLWAHNDSCLGGFKGELEGRTEGSKYTVGEIQSYRLAKGALPEAVEGVKMGPKGVGSSPTELRGMFQEGVRPGDQFLYILKDVNTGQTLKVGKTENMGQRLIEYARAEAKLNEMGIKVQLEITFMKLSGTAANKAEAAKMKTIDPTGKPETISSVESALRAKVLTEGTHLGKTKLPWDMSPEGPNKNRLIDAGFGKDVRYKDPESGYRQTLPPDNPRVLGGFLHELPRAKLEGLIDLTKVPSIDALLAKYPHPNPLFKGASTGGGS